MRRFTKHRDAKDLREQGRIILAHGEVTGHHHEVVADRADCDDLPSAEYFEEPSGRRVLLVLRPCVLRHQEHGPIALDPDTPTIVRQGDVLLKPIGAGAWEVVRQREYAPEEIRNVAD